jgi:uncharacterized protein (DUF1330 family)
VSRDQRRTELAAYVILDVEVTDAEAYEDYKKVSPGPVAAYGGRFIVRGGASEILEGGWTPNRIVILEFENAERAREWWNSPEYEKPKALRQRASKGNMILVDGIQEKR